MTTSLSVPSSLSLPLIEIVLTSGTSAQVDGRPFAFSEWRARAGVTPQIARTLVREGHDPRTPVRVTRNGTVVFKDATLGAWAAICVEEGERQSGRIRKHRARDFGEVRGEGSHEPAKDAVPA